MPITRPDALILDDGELQDVRLLLDQLGALYGSEGDEVALQEVPLLITSLARARRLHEKGHPLPKHAIHLVVADADDHDLGGSLAGTPCDFIVRRPVDAAILALITRRAGYHGPERRKTLRVAMGTPVHVGMVGSDAREDAILAQLSVAGCGLITRDPLPDVNLRIEFPPELSSPRTLALDGRIAKSREVPTADGLVYDTSVVFDDVTLSDRVTLRALMAGQPIDFRPESRPPLARRAEDHAGDRRRDARVPYEHGALGGSSDRRWTRVLIGRDISTRGMRVEREPDLALGDDVRLALYASDREEPVLVKARVTRDDGDEGWYLGFECDDAGEQARIEHLMADLQDDHSDSRQVWVISEVLGGS